MADVDYPHVDEGDDPRPLEEITTPELLEALKKRTGPAKATVSAPEIADELGTTSSIAGMLFDERDLPVDRTDTGTPRRWFVTDELYDVGERYRESPSIAAVLSQLTEGQQTLLTKAYAAGYFSWPRDIDMQDLAAAADFADSAYQKRLRTAERVLVSAVVETAALEAPEPPDE